MQKARVKEVLLDDFGDPEGKEASSNQKLSQENLSEMFMCITNSFVLNQESTQESPDPLPHERIRSAY